MNPESMLCVIPSRVGVGEEFELRIKLTGPPRAIPSAAQWNTPKPALRGPFNLNVERRIQYLDNCLPEWQGDKKRGKLAIRAASEEGIQDVTIVGNEGDLDRLQPEADARHIEAVTDVGEPAPDRFCYVRVTTKRGDMAWSSPVWGAENASCA